MPPQTRGDTGVMVIDKSQKFTTLVRLGFAARGITYLLLGFLALSASGKAMEGQNGVFDYIQTIPLGTPLLWIIALGLAAYALFKLIAAATNLENHAEDAKGTGKRVGELASGIIHSFLAYAAYRFVTGGEAQGRGAQDMAAPVMDVMLGELLIGLGGLGMLIAAAMQAASAITADFMRHIDGRAPRAVQPVGRAGHAARAIVFAVIGWSLISAAWLNSGGAVKGLGEALLTLKDLGVVYTLVAVGLLLFGAFSLVTARYRIIPDIRSGDLKPNIPQPHL